MHVTKHISTFNTLDLRNDQTLGLQSLLHGLNYSYAPSLVRNIDNALNKSNLFSYIYLSSFFGIPALSAVALHVCLEFDFIEQKDIKRLLYNFAPVYTSGVVDLLTIFSVNIEQRPSLLFNHFSYDPLDTTGILQQPRLYYDWLVTQEPAALSTVNYLHSGDIPNFLSEVVRVDIGFDPRSKPQLWNLLNYWSFISFSPFVIGHDYNQVFR